MKKTTLILIALAAALLLPACSSGDDGDGVSADDGGGESLVEPDLGAPEESVESGGAEGRDQALSAVDLPGVGPKVIQTATLGVVVEDGRFDEAVRQARAIASRLGGFVVSSHTERLDDDAPRNGTLVLRVPGESYASAMDALGRLGRIELEGEQGQDVSQEFVDLEARRRHLEAVEAQLLELLERAGTVQAALAVQAQLNATQLELEQVRGRLRYLEDQTDLATITLDLREPDPEQADAGGWGVVDAWKAGAHAFVTVARWAFVLAGAVAPLLLVGALGWLAARLVRRRRAAAPTG